jgi:hypothetical protein
MPLGLLDLGALAARLEAATGRRVDLVVMDEAPPALAYRIFRDGQTIVVRDKPALDARRARAILDALDFRPVEQLCARGIQAAAVVDRTILASKIASVRDAVARIRAVLPADIEAFVSDRTTREVVVLNLFVALQECTESWTRGACLPSPPSASTISLPSVLSWPIARAETRGRTTGGMSALWAQPYSGQ